MAASRMPGVVAWGGLVDRSLTLGNLDGMRLENLVGGAGVLREEGGKFTLLRTGELEQVQFD